jgi:lipoate-protein ligase A
MNQLVDMMKKWRLIDTDIGHPYYVTAVEEAICTAKANDIVPDTLHFYRRDPPGVSVGYFKKVKDDVNMKFCEENNVVIVRRMTGGGTIFTDKNQLIYSIITKKQLGDGIENTFEIVCNAIIEALKSFNLEAKYKPPNDILVNGKKISGSAQTLKKEVVLLHGTILVDADLKLMKNVLKHSNLDYLTTIKKENPIKTHSMAVVKKALIQSFENLFSIKIMYSSLTEFETELTNKLMDEKYSIDDWNYKR